MKNIHEEILKILDSKSKLEWQDKHSAVFSIGSTDRKYINGSLVLTDKDLFSLNITDTNYSAPYLARKFNSAASALKMEVYRSESSLSFYAALEPNDQIWIYSDGYGSLSAGQQITLPKGTEFYKSKSTQLLCSPVGNLKQNYSAVFKSYESEKCNPQAVTTYYAVFQLQ